MVTSTESPDPRPRLVVARTTLTRAVTAATCAGQKETGGVLVGFRADADVYVTDAIVVPADVATRVRYVTSEANREAALATFRAQHPHEDIGYVGTWHSHLAWSRASPTDLRTLRSEAADAPDLVAMLIVTKSRRGWRSVAYIGHRERTFEHRRGHRALRNAPWSTPVEVVIVDS